MPVINTDMKWYLSGGSGNTDGNASLGGAISTTEVPTSINDLFDAVTGQEASDGSIEYRCIYLKNTNGSSTLSDIALWIQANTTSAYTTLDIGLDPAGIGDGSSTGVATQASPTDEVTAPSGVTFNHSPAPIDLSSGLAIGNLDAGEVQAIWLRRTVTAGAPALSSDDATLRIEGTP